MFTGLAKILKIKFLWYQLSRIPKNLYNSMNYQLNQLFDIQRGSLWFAASFSNLFMRHHHLNAFVCYCIINSSLFSILKILSKYCRKHTLSNWKFFREFTRSEEERLFNKVHIFHLNINTRIRFLVVKSKLRILKVAI